MSFSLESEKLQPSTKVDPFACVLADFSIAPISTGKPGIITMKKAVETCGQILQKHHLKYEIHAHGTNIGKNDI